MPVFAKILTVCLLLLAFGTPLAAQPDIAQIREQALAGDAWAQLNYGAAFDHGLSGIPADPVEAVRWYRKSAAQGVDKAQFNLAHCLATGHGTPQDYVESRLWMRKAAAQGMADAQFLLGVMLSEGLGGEIEAAAGRDWLQRVAEAGQADAAAYLQNLR